MLTFHERRRKTLKNFRTIPLTLVVYSKIYENYMERSVEGKNS